MADEKIDETEGGKPGGGKRKLMVIGAACMLLLLGSGAGGAWFFGLLGGGVAAEPSAEAAAAAAAAAAAKRREAVVFVDMPDVLVNLQSVGQRTRFLKLKVALEVENEATADQVKTLMPRVMDSFQTYLRALTVDEVSRPGGLHRLKEELTARVNLALAPTRVDDVLVKEMLVQ
jgi:flagellar FliL protein